MSTYEDSRLVRWHLKDSYGLTGWGLIVFGLGGAIVGFAAMCAVIIASCRAYGRTTCAHWGEQTGYPSKFVVLNWADTGTCLAKAPNGRWVLNTKVLTFTGQKP